MTDTTNPRQEQMEALCKELDLRPFQRLKSPEVCEILGTSEVTLNRMRANGSISYLRIGERGIGFFAYQVATYILDSVVETKTCPDTTSQKKSTKLETTGSPNNPEVQPGVGHGTTSNLSKRNDLASARRILKRRSSD